MTWVCTSLDPRVELTVRDVRQVRNRFYWIWGDYGPVQKYELVKP